MLHFLLQPFRLISFRALYVLSDALAFFLFRIIGYRRAVIFGNLRRAFPEKNQTEINAIARATYQNLTDVTLETLKSFSTPIAEIKRRCVVTNPEIVNAHLDRGQSIILTGSHLGNWEFSGISMPPLFHGKSTIAYKPLSNKGMDAYINRARSRTGGVMISMDEVFGTMRRQTRESPTVFILLSDQSPSSRKSAHWVDFFGQKTASLPGADVLARKFGFPVVNYRVRRLRRGFYEVEFSELCTEPGIAPEKSITQAYAHQLEADIRVNPAQWLWSHKRWKMEPETSE